MSAERTNRLHDVFAVPFNEIAPIVGRSEAARQPASRARRRVKAENALPDADLEAQREVVEAFLEVARDGDFDRLVAVLDPDCVLRADLGPLAEGSRAIRGATAIASQALTYSRLGLLSSQRSSTALRALVLPRNSATNAIREPTLTGGGDFQSTDLMLTYQAASREGDLRQPATASRTRSKRRA